jgi:protein-arginine kinase activator protein McsA
MAIMIFRKEGQRPQLILDSNPRPPKAIQGQLNDAVEREDYERAAVLRDRIKARREKREGEGTKAILH